MFRFVIILFFVGTCVANLNDLWSTFKSLHSKNYSDKEDSVRKSIFESSIKLVNDHNLHYDLGLSSFRLGLNQFADMTSDEFQQYKGLDFNASAVSSVSSQPVVSDEDLPASKDWRIDGYVTNVKNQKQCGSCWAFSATGAVEGQHFRHNGQLISVSEQQLVDCSRMYNNHGCNGGNPTNAFEYIKVKGGLNTEEAYPYVGIDQTCKVEDDRPVKVTGFKTVQSRSEPALQKAVATIGPISVCIDATSTMKLYTDGVYDAPCSSTLLNHAVLAVGYGTTVDKKDYWIVKNSWGETWGEKGYIRIARNHNNHCGIATQASYPTVV